jgi:hypothetical protein
MPRAVVSVVPPPVLAFQKLFSAVGPCRLIRGLMKLLVIGSGGREHALVWKLAQSPHVTQLWCAPGNAGIAGEKTHAARKPVECVEISAEDLPRLLAFALERKPDLTIVGPDNPLALGIVDLFQQKGLRIWGPNQRAAQFEASKAFAQEFMERHGIPTARAGAFTDPDSAKAFAAELGGRCVVKADGLALGKGVLVCESDGEANRAVDEILVSKTFGAAGARIVIQEFLEGIEVFERVGSDTEAAELRTLYCAQVPVRRDGNSSFMHSKVIVVDERYVITGSLNFSTNAETSNDENVIIIDNPEIARLYLQDFDRIWALGSDPDPGTIACP